MHPRSAPFLSALLTLGVAAQSPPPAIEAEPLLKVLVARGPRVAVHIDREVRLETPAGFLKLAAATHVFEARGEGWGVSGSDLSFEDTGLLPSQGRPIFRVDATPLFGEPRRLRLAGDLLVHAAAGQVEVIERLPMERYLAAVVAAEMNPGWPVQALAAQAIVARSYAAARWMERNDEAWQLHWHFGVDMAYHGWSEQHASVARAIAPTRGEMLMYRGFPVLALFNASSGGLTEAFDRIKPGVLAPDRKTPIAAAMPVVEDDAALPGAKGLALSASHGRWKSDIPLPEVTSALQRWSKAGQGRPSFGTVEAVSILERHDDSGRVDTVSIRHRLDGKTRFQSLPATDFRMAVSPLRIRSTLWDRCVIASKAPGYLVLNGRGFGHGCGLSQVSAWYLAKKGASAEAIVARFYSGAKIERRY
jgi:peptidoglycan hydrolase-like amidase